MEHPLDIFIENLYKCYNIYLQVVVGVRFVVVFVVVVVAAVVVVCMYIWCLVYRQRSSSPQ